jgi:RimJ/RimL family protein N-acetyltransferase
VPGGRRGRLTSAPLDATFRPYDPSADEAALVDLLVTETWAYRVKPRLDPAEVAEELAKGEYHSDAVLTLVIEQEGRMVGFARAFDLGEERSDPQLDFRLRAGARGQGLGTEAVRRITDAVFTAHPGKIRIEGQTRADNVAMRKAFLRAGYVQEAVYRQAWPGHDGTVHDGTGYAILRTDWETGTTTPVDWSIP